VLVDFLAVGWLEGSFHDGIPFNSVFFKLTPLHPSLSERGGKGCPATSYPLSRIERGTRGELRKAKKTCQFLTFSPGFYKISKIYNIYSYIGFRQVQISLSWPSTIFP
jgi:hypothetical protein